MTRARIATLVAVAVGSLLAAVPAFAVVAVPGTLPGATQTTINNGIGNQTDPHVSGDIAAYTADTSGGLTQIRYYNFATGFDGGIDNDGSIDLLSDVNAGRVVFTRIGSGKAAIMLFDGTTTTELDPAAGSKRRGAAIGGNTVAWIDLSTGSAGEIVAHDLTSGTSTTLTSNALVDRRVAVSPSGNVLVWEQCASATANCDIIKAVTVGAGWAVSNVTSTADHESFPDTNGAVVVYGSSRATSLGGPDIYWTDLAGGTEQQLELAGTQQDPNVSGSFVAFESQQAGSSTFDIYLYDLSTDLLYQLTTTPGLDETLNDVSVSGTTGRIVWSVFEGSDYNVYGATFTIPASSVAASVAFDPGTINLKSRGAYLTAFLEFPAGRDPADVDVASLTLQAIDPVTSSKVPIAAGSPSAVGDTDGDGTPDLMVKFDRATVQSWFSAAADPASLRIEGRFIDGTPLQGDAAVRVIDAGVTHTDEGNPASVRY